jgi:hypothetical protein
LSISNTPETTGVTSFVQEACTNLSVLSGKASHLFSPSSNIQNLTEYFRRPVTIAAGTLPTGTYSNVFAQTATASNIVSSFPNGAARLQGVFGYRATLVYTLQVAATPFHQGVIALSFQYGAGTSFTTTFRRYLNSMAVTNLPHVRLDLASDTMVQLRVPYLGSLEYLPTEQIIANNADFVGIAAVNMIQPVQAVTGMTAPTYQILFHLEDLELFGAKPNAVGTLSLQSGKDPVSREFEQEGYPFSSGTMALSRAFKWFSYGVPMLSSVGGTTSWFLAKAAGAIRAFGFARPTIVDPPQRMVVFDNVLECNADIPSACNVVGPMASNRLRIDDKMGGTDADEMSLKYVSSQWSQICIGSIATTLATGAVFYAAPVSPSCFWARAPTATPYYNIRPPSASGATANAFLPSSLMFVSSMFKYWKGSIRFRFTFAKTKMHAARVLVSFSPYVDAQSFTDVTTLPVPIKAASYGTPGPDVFGYSAIFDLKDGNIFEFEIPYMSPSPWSAFQDAIGCVTMSLVNPLIAPSVVSNTITFMVEVCGGSNYELADPFSPIWPAHNSPTLRLQSGGVVVSDTADNVCEYTVGECVSSLKQLIAIPHVTCEVFPATPEPFDGAYAVMIPPWFYQPAASALVPGATSFKSGSFSFGGNIAAAYAFATGSTDLHVYQRPTVPASRPSYMCVRQRNLESSTTITTASATSRGPSAAPLVQSSVTGVMHVRLPPYQKFARIAVSALNDILTWSLGYGFSAQPTINFSNRRGIVFYNLSVDTPTDADLFCGRAAGDDARATTYLGPAPFALLSGATASTPWDTDASREVFGDI